MEAPPQITPTRLADYLDVMSKAVFQSGMSWRVVEAKWPGFREVFQEFDPNIVADLTPPEIDRIAQDTRIIRNRRKIEATVDNAATLLELDRSHNGFKNYLKSHASYADLERDLQKRFKFLGGMGIYYFLYVVGEPVPPHEEFMASRR
jgi:3-methyladenine DNA glycosylase Tag